MMRKFFKFVGQIFFLVFAAAIGSGVLWFGATKLMPFHLSYRLTFWAMFVLLIFFWALLGVATWALSPWMKTYTDLLRQGYKEEVAFRKAGEVAKFPPKWLRGKKLKSFACFTYPAFGSRR